MSISNLFYPNNLSINADTLTVSTLNATTENIANLTTNSVITDFVTAKTTNGNLSLNGNGTGNVSIDSGNLITNSVTAKTTNGNLSLNGNGTGNVSIDSGNLITDSVTAKTTNNSLILAGNGIGNVAIQSLQNLIMDGGSITTTAGNLTLDSSGTIQCNRSLYLPTPGGTPSGLNYYEEWTGDAVFTGALTNTITNGIYIERINNRVFVRIFAYSATATATSPIIIGFANPLPSRFRPITLAGAEFTIVVVDNGTGKLGSISIGTGGYFTITNGVNSENFTSGNGSGYNSDINISYTVI